MFVNEATVYIVAAALIIAVFPIYIHNYIYVYTEEKFASLNITAYRFLKLYNINTVKNKPHTMQINGKDKNIDLKALKYNYYKMFNKLCIYKIIQLSDFGLKNQNNAYAALAQNAITYTFYKTLQINGNYSKLRNYTLLNEGHSDIRYYAKAVTIVNVLVIAKIFIIYLTEKFNEYKNKKEQG